MSEQCFHCSDNGCDIYSIDSFFGRLEGRTESRLLSFRGSTLAGAMVKGEADDTLAEHGVVVSAFRFTPFFV